jgi:recombination protein RecT
METKAPESRELVTAKDRSATLRKVLEDRKNELRTALPRHLTPDRMLRLVFTACAKSPKLLECSPGSVYGAVLQCAQLGLEPDLLGQAYLVPFYNNKKKQMECQLIPGYKGLLTLARRSGEISSIDARVVREGDTFEYEYGLSPKLIHRPQPDALGDLTHVYAIARFRHGGEPQWDVMTKGQVEGHRRRSRAAESGPWVTDYEAMCLKTVLRVLCKLLPASVELQTAVELDERFDAGLPQDLPALEPMIDTSESQEVPQGEGAAA